MAKCAPQIQACSLRVSRLDSTGGPDPGASGMYVSDALVSMGFTSEVTEGEEFELPNACGDVITFKDDDKIRRLAIELSIRIPDPELTEILVGGAVLGSDEAAGYGFPELNAVANPNGMSIELWAKRITAGNQQDPDHPWMWWVFPNVKLQVNDGTFENGPFTPTFSGFAGENPNWGDGPTNDHPHPTETWRVASYVPTATKPDAACSYVELVAS